MTINVGLFVHDKINLQNSVDLASYYAASKQAEVLNLMSHINFRMRQNWKLLAYRIRAIGSSGHSSHPFRAGGTGLVYPEQNNEFPIICTNHGFWDLVSFNNKIPQIGNLCSSINVIINELPTTNVVAGFGFVGELNKLTASLTKQMSARSRDHCEFAGSTNWLTGLNWVKQFHSFSNKQSQIFRQLFFKIKRRKRLKRK